MTPEQVEGVHTWAVQSARGLAPVEDPIYASEWLAALWHMGLWDIPPPDLVLSLVGWVALRWFFSTAPELHFLLPVLEGWSFCCETTNIIYAQGSADNALGTLRRIFAARWDLRL